jgi:hypothetical protein
VTYTAGGTYQARLMVTDAGGLTATSTPVTITVTSPTGPRNTSPPTVSGSPVVGGTLSSSAGTWTGTAPITYARRWQRCTGSPGAPTCADISGATGTTYSPQLADEARTLRVQVTASNAGGTSTAMSAVVGPVTGGSGNTPPQPLISGPAVSFHWKAGDTITYSGSATDAQDGTVPAARLSWNIILGHCTTQGCHNHPLATRTGRTGTVSAPDHEAPSYIEFTLTATDAVGATASVTRRVDPLTSSITFQSDPGGLTLAVGAQQSTPTPFTQLWVVNSQVQVSAPRTQVLGGLMYALRGWSDMGVSTHITKVPAANTTYTAAYGVACSTVTYAGAVAADQPLVSWRLSERSGTTAGDASGHGQSGAYLGSPLLGQAGAVRGDPDPAPSFDGNDDRVIRNPIDGVAATAVSTDLWLRTTNTTKEAGIVSYAAAGSADEFQLRDPRNLDVIVKGTMLNTGVALNDGQWHHLAVTWQSAGGEVRVYRDGVQVYSGSVRAGALLTANGALVLAQDQDSLGGGFQTAQAFAGQLDEVALYPGVLSAARVQAHRQAGVVPGCRTTTAVPVLIAPYERTPDPRNGLKLN